MKFRYAYMVVCISLHGNVYYSSYRCGASGSYSSLNEKHDVFHGYLIFKC